MALEADKYAPYRGLVEAKNPTSGHRAPPAQPCAPGEHTGRRFRPRNTTLPVFHDLSVDCANVPISSNDPCQPGEIAFAIGIEKSRVPTSILPRIIGKASRGAEYSFSFLAACSTYVAAQLREEERSVKRTITTDRLLAADYSRRAAHGVHLRNLLDEALPEEKEGGTEEWRDKR
ncbi:hypothetical protein KM043_000415 [Ampulex compressa]|nr:hypothetical protein KM043_000415 [Ampulex compressa]